MERNTHSWEAYDPRMQGAIERLERAKEVFQRQLAKIGASYGLSYEHCLRRHAPMEENPGEMHDTEEEMLLGGESQASRAPRRDRNRDIIERTLALAKRAEDLSGEVTYNSATETGTREKIDAFKAHMEQGVKMGEELMALFKA